MELYRIRKNGYSEEYDALFTGVSALSVPIFNRYHNELFGSVSLTGMSPMIKKRRQEIMLRFRRMRVICRIVCVFKAEMDGAGSDPATIHFYDLTGQVIRCFYEFHDEVCDFLRLSHAAGGNLV